MSEKRLSHCQGKGSLTHNNRKFNAKNVDGTRTKDNVVFIQQPIGEAYEQLFRTAVERYNARQQRADRKIKTSYFQNIALCFTPAGNGFLAASVTHFFQSLCNSVSGINTALVMPNGYVVDMQVRCCLVKV